jgi:hypothetical protein
LKSFSNKDALRLKTLLKILAIKTRDIYDNLIEKRVAVCTSSISTSQISSDE